MKLATLKDGTRDGTLLVVSKNLKRAFDLDARLIMRSRKQELPADFKKEPLMYQGCSDPLLGPCDDIAVSDEAHGIDLEMELGVITGDVPMGVDKDQAGEEIRLLVLLNDVSLRAPVAVTPDELGEPDAGTDMQ